METAIINSSAFNNYWNMLKGLSVEMKEALIAKLSESINTHKPSVKVDESWDGLFGIMKDDEFPSIDEIKSFEKKENIENIASC